jgi:hypothetical protein
LKKKLSFDIKQQFDKAVSAKEPDPLRINDHVFAPTTINEEQGRKITSGKRKGIDG